MTFSSFSPCFLFEVQIFPLLQKGSLIPFITFFPSSLLLSFFRPTPHCWLTYFFVRISRVKTMCRGHHTAQGSLGSQLIPVVSTGGWQCGQMLLPFLSWVPTCPFQMVNQTVFLHMFLVHQLTELNYTKWSLFSQKILDGILCPSCVNSFTPKLFDLVKRNPS